ncbi:glycosyltransferase family 4 protein [Limnoglobus roseus]|uniref:GT4 family glycosyltransferase n=1 Tax=Limnoglobus roseus TaxID=2598579 RepID=A0A5C1ARK7_9BACT|nr:glycosyltransferase family 4 protein [Limnoglobus roseus]QEL20332.1 GT4 family glycosyltransferase [Limnoglobus roseus]
MHVAHFVQRYPPALGGSESYFERLTNHLAGQGDTVTVFTTTAVELGELWGKPGHPTPEVATPEKVRVRRYCPLFFPARRYVLKALSLLPIRPVQALTLPCNPICPAMWRDAGNFTEPLDAVHATAFPYTFPIACGLRLARKRKVPFFLTPFLHLGDPADPHDRTRKQYTRPVMRWLLQQADGVFVQTEGERRAVIGLGVPESRVILQGLGVDPAECTGGDRGAARAKWGVGDELVIGHLANLSAEKGTVDLLRANLPNRVVLAGPTMPNFERFWQTYPHQDRVTRLGVLTDGEKRDFFAGIDVFALPSRTDSFGLVLLEAWANAKPVIVYRAGGPAELVRDGVDGRVVDCTPNAIRDAVTRGGFAAMGATGRERVEREFAWGPRLEIVRRAMSR